MGWSKKNNFKKIVKNNYWQGGFDDQVLWQQMGRKCGMIQYETRQEGMNHWYDGTQQLWGSLVSCCIVLCFIWVQLSVAKFECTYPLVWKILSLRWLRENDSVLLWNIATGCLVSYSIIQLPLVKTFPSILLHPLIPSDYFNRTTRLSFDSFAQFDDVNRCLTILL